MPKNSALPNINFAGEEDLATRAGGKFVAWALTYGKIVIVLTELVVVSSFISRFVLDSRIADLNEQIQKKKAIIVASADFEKQFRAFSTRVETVGTILSEPGPDKILPQADKLIPEGVTVSSLSIKQQTVSLTGTATDERVLAFIGSSFRDADNFTDVSVERVAKTDQTNKENRGIDFSLSAHYRAK